VDEEEEGGDVEVDEDELNQTNVSPVASPVRPLSRMSNSTTSLPSEVRLIAEIRELVEVQWCH
jgi:hypothetical protein